MCDDEYRPIEMRSCSESSYCKYKWKVHGWERCRNGEQYRTIECMDRWTLQVVNESFCNPLDEPFHKKPESHRYCTCNTNVQSGQFWSIFTIGRCNGMILGISSIASNDVSILERINSAPLNLACRDATCLQLKYFYDGPLLYKTVQICTDGHSDEYSRTDQVVSYVTTQCE
jgi:hypothetical protein